MTTLWKTDEELFSLARRELFTAVVGDIMDKLELHHQFLPPRIRPLDPNMVGIGRAMTVLAADCCESALSGYNNPVMAKPFGLMLEALDDLRANELYLCTGASHRYALWGELMSVRAMKLGAVGVVLDGYLRDTKGILALGFPSFSYGAYAQDSSPRGKVIDFRIAVEIDGTRINPGDIVFGDIDGVCVVPREAEEEVFAGALEKARGEKTVMQALESGMSAAQAFEKYGIL